MFDPDKVGQRCEFCGSAQLVPYEQVKDSFRPESLLPLKVSESQARDLIRALVPASVARAEHAERESADRHGQRRLSAVLDVRRQGARHLDSRFRRVLLHPRGRQAACNASDGRRPRVSCRTSSTMTWWRRRSASMPAVLRSVEPFPTERLDSVRRRVSCRMDGRALSDRSGERRRPIAAADGSDTAATVRRPGSWRHVSQPRSCRPTFTDQRFKHILVPVWLLTYTYGATSYQVVVNGVTGQIAGGHPWSWMKITLLVILVLFIIYLIGNSSS